jgi:hypothetical protein
LQDALALKFQVTKSHPHEFRDSARLPLADDDGGIEVGPERKDNVVCKIVSLVMNVSIFQRECHLLKIKASDL